MRGWLKVFRADMKVQRVIGQPVAPPYCSLDKRWKKAGLAAQLFCPNLLYRCDSMEKFFCFLSEIDLARDISSLYSDFRKNFSVTATIRKLCGDLAPCLVDIDDAPIFWLALANSMAQQKELTEKIYAKALKYLETPDTLKSYWGIMKFSAEDIEEIKSFLNGSIGRAKRRPATPQHSTSWLPQDFHAMPIISQKAAELGVLGRYLIFQTIGSCIWDRELVPIVYVYITPSCHMPTSEDELKKCIPIPTRTYCTPYCYRFNILSGNSTNRSEFNSIIHIGNFKDFPFLKEALLEDFHYNALLEWENVENRIMNRIKILLELQCIEL